LGFEVSVDDPARVAVVDTVAKLEEKEFDLVGSHGKFVFAEVFLHVILDQFKDEIEFLFGGHVNHFAEAE
jgi:hypothetical protein